MRYCLFQYKLWSLPNSEQKDFPDYPVYSKLPLQKQGWPGFGSHIFLVVKDTEKFNVVQNYRDKSGCQTSKQNSAPSRDKVFSHEMRDLKMYDNISEIHSCSFIIPALIFGCKPS